MQANHLTTVQTCMFCWSSQLDLLLSTSSSILHCPSVTSTSLCMVSLSSAFSLLLLDIAHLPLLKMQFDFASEHKISLQWTSSSHWSAPSQQHDMLWTWMLWQTIILHHQIDQNKGRNAANNALERNFPTPTSKKRIIGKTHETVVIEPKQIAIGPKSWNTICILGLNFPRLGANTTSSTMQSLNDACISTKQGAKVCQALRECLIYLLFHPNWMVCLRGKKQLHWIT